MVPSMKQTKKDLEVIERVARAVIKEEHQCFVNEELDNDDHIPRVMRISAAVETVLHEMEFPKDAVRKMVRSLEKYAKDLFLSVWMSQIMEGEDEEEEMAKGVAEFNRTARKT